jgi:hypothetical protein
MTREVLSALVIVAAFGCTPTPAPTTSNVGGPARDSTSAVLTNLTDRVWARTDSTGLPGVMRVFLANGTLLMDSCWETYRLCPWRLENDSSVVWQEDSVEIRAWVMRVDADSLVMRLNLVDGPHEEHYNVAPVPYVCPDMKR